MMKEYFNIRYEFERERVHEAIAERLRRPGGDYVCVADGNILAMVHRDMDYRAVVNGGMFSICDSSYVPLYLKRLYGLRVGQYCGSEIFEDIVRGRRYRMAFLGTHQRILDGLRRELSAKMNPDVEGMLMVELPFCDVDGFDYESIARMVEEDGAEIIWVALGAPKQEQFMARLKPYLRHGVMIAVGAAFKFYSGTDVKRAPQWAVKCHLEFVDRIFREPRKQLRRCSQILTALPAIWREEKSRHMGE